MKKSMVRVAKTVGLLLSVLGLALFSFLFVVWSTEEYSTYSVPVWPMVLGIVIAVLGFICVKAGNAAMENRLPDAQTSLLQQDRKGSATNVTGEPWTGRIHLGCEKVFRLCR